MESDVCQAVLGNTTEKPQNVVNGKDIAFIIGHFLLACIIITGNVLVIIVTVRFRPLRTVTNMFISSLSIADLLVGFSLPYLALFFIIPTLKQMKYACLLRYLPILISSSASILSLVAVALDRHIAIAYPLRYKSIVTHGKVAISITCIWIYASIIGSLPVLGLNNWDSACVCVFETVINKAYLLFCSASFAVCIILVIFIYIKLLLAARRQQRQIYCEMSGFINMDPALRKQLRESKATKTLALILVIFTVCWIPHFILMTFRLLVYTDYRLHTVGVYLVLLATVNSAINPVIYAIMRKEFRSAIKRLLLRKKHNAVFSVSLSMGPM